MLVLLMLRARSLSVILLTLLFALAGCSDPPPDCSLVEVARLKLQMEHGLPLVAVAIDGHPVWMVADTGAERSILTEDAVGRLRLQHDIGRVSRTIGIGGPSTNWDVIVESMVMGGVRFPVDRFAVGKFNIVNDGSASPAGLLGADVLLAFDVDIDFSDNSITLYRARRCQDAYPPWEQPAIPIPGVTSRKDRLLIPLTLDGAAATGLLDTGAQQTTIGSQLATRLGLTEEAMADDPVIMQHGAGPVVVPSHLHRFARLTIGPAVAVDPQLTVVPSGFGVGDALVGQDFLRGRRVWISFATNRVFVTSLPGEAALAVGAP
ncbi:MAG: retropepsin-like aspartic protease [Acetobacteraceae bacterium]|nr:retropepsin-like aspartic protease [Acetobacteraceae bacterium]